MTSKNNPKLDILNFKKKFKLILLYITNGYLITKLDQLTEIPRSSKIMVSVLKFKN